MEKDICPASNAELGRVFPGLEAIVVDEIVKWVPVVKGLVAILDRCIVCRNQVRYEADI